MNTENSKTSEPLKNAALANLSILHLEKHQVRMQQQ